jgi:hypothetical protein
VAARIGDGRQLAALGTQNCAAKKNKNCTLAASSPYRSLRLLSFRGFDKTEMSLKPRPLDIIFRASLKAAARRSGFALIAPIRMVEARDKAAPAGSEP